MTRVACIVWATITLKKRYITVTNSHINSVNTADYVSSFLAFTIITCWYTDTTYTHSVMPYVH